MQDNKQIVRNSVLVNSVGIVTQDSDCQQNFNAKYHLY